MVNEKKSIDFYRAYDKHEPDSGDTTTLYDERDGSSYQVKNFEGSL